MMLLEIVAEFQVRLDTASFSTSGTVCLKISNPACFCLKVPGDLLTLRRLLPY